MCWGVSLSISEIWCFTLSSCRMVLKKHLVLRVETPCGWERSQEKDQTRLSCQDSDGNPNKCSLQTYDMPNPEAYGLQRPKTMLCSSLSSARREKKDTLSRQRRFHPRICCSLDVLFFLTQFWGNSRLLCVKIPGDKQLVKWPKNSPLAYYSQSHCEHIGPYSSWVNAIASWPVSTGMCVHVIGWSDDCISVSITVYCECIWHNT